MSFGRHRTQAKWDEINRKEANYYSKMRKKIQDPAVRKWFDFGNTLPVAKSIAVIDKA